MQGPTPARTLFPPQAQPSVCPPLTEAATCRTLGGPQELKAAVNRLQTLLYAP